MWFISFCLLYIFSKINIKLRNIREKRKGKSKGKEQDIRKRKKKMNHKNENKTNKIQSNKLN